MSLTPGASRRRSEAILTRSGAAMPAERQLNAREYDSREDAQALELAATHIAAVLAPGRHNGV